MIYGYLEISAMYSPQRSTFWCIGSVHDIWPNWECNKRFTENGERASSSIKWYFSTRPVWVWWNLFSFSKEHIYRYTIPKYLTYSSSPRRLLYFLLRLCHFKISPLFIIWISKCLLLVEWVTGIHVGTCNGLNPPLTQLMDAYQRS